MTSTELAWQIRRKALDMVRHAKASHIGSILSVADILAVLYDGVAKIDPEDPMNPARDRIVLSKGHAGVALYVALAETGFYPVEKLNTYGDDGSDLSCHVSHKNNPGIELSTGSLGHGLSVGTGMALHASTKGLSHRIYVIMGDGECNEGAVWEAALFASHHRLCNLCVIIDCNHMQAMGDTGEILDMAPLAKKWRTFGWHTVEVTDGHDHEALFRAMRETNETRPVAVIAHTVKGKGVSFMENTLLWHYRDPQGTFYEEAVRELERNRP